MEKILLTDACTQTSIDDPIDNRVVQAISERFPLDRKYVEKERYDEDGNDINVDWYSFDIPVAPNFEKFIQLLS